MAAAWANLLLGPGTNDSNVYRSGNGDAAASRSSRRAWFGSARAARAALAPRRPWRGAADPGEGSGCGSRSRLVAPPATAPGPGADGTDGSERGSETASRSPGAAAEAASTEPGASSCEAA